MGWIVCLFLIHVGLLVIRCDAQNYTFSASSTSVANGSSVTFTCETPDVSDLNWYYAGPPVETYTVLEDPPGPNCSRIGDIPDSFSFTCSRSAKTFTLTINGVTCQNAGLWQCQNRVFGKPVSNSETITVTGANVLLNHTEIEEKGDSTTITCRTVACSNTTNIKLFVGSVETPGMISYPAPTSEGFQIVMEATVTPNQSTNAICDADGVRKTIFIEVPETPTPISPDCEICQKAAIAMLVIVLLLFVGEIIPFVMIINGSQNAILVKVFYGLAVVTILVCFGTAVGLGVGCHQKCPLAIITADIVISVILIVVDIVLIIVVAKKFGPGISTCICPSLPPEPPDAGPINKPVLTDSDKPNDPSKPLKDSAPLKQIDPTRAKDPTNKTTGAGDPKIKQDTNNGSENRTETGQDQRVSLLSKVDET